MPVFKNNKNPLKKIVFQAYSPHLAQMFSSLVEALKKDEGVEIYFIVMFHPYHGFKSLRDTRKYALNVLKIRKSNILYIWQVFWRKFDCLICSDNYAKFPLLKTKKILIPHGHGLSQRKIKKNILRKTIYDFDAYFLAGEFGLVQLKRFIKQKPDLLVSGFPFMDPLSEKEKSREKLFKDLGVDDDKKIVLFAPNWRSYLFGERLSVSFDDVMKCLMEKDVTIFVKLHAVSYIRAQSKGISWQRKLKKYAGLNNVKIINDLNDIPYFKLADILVADPSSSRAFCFMITDKPVIIAGMLEAYYKDPFTRALMDKMKEAAYIAKSTKELSEVLDHCIKHPAEMSIERKKVVKEIFSHIGHATHENIKLIKRIMEQDNTKREV
ncbi:CDP-glycerol glycerophosphotransferase family protein [Thermodesulfobacteriota bacterium]